MKKYLLFTMFMFVTLAAVSCEKDDHDHIAYVEVR